MIEPTNPGNIRYNSSLPGVVGSVRGFSVFASQADGIAAILTILKTYWTKYGLKTIRQIIGRYAPSSDGNNVSRYVSNLSSWSGFGPDEVLEISDLPKLIPGIIRQESGLNFTFDQVLQKISQAGRSGSSFLFLGFIGIVAAWVFWKK